MHIVVVHEHETCVCVCVCVCPDQPVAVLWLGSQQMYQGVCVCVS